MSSDTNVWCLFIKSGGKSFFKGIINYNDFLCNYSNHLQHRSAHNLLSLQFLWFIQHGDIKGRPRAILLCRHIDAKVDIAEKIFSRRARRCAHFVRTTCHCADINRCSADALCLFQLKRQKSPFIAAFEDFRDTEPKHWVPGDALNTFSQLKKFTFKVRKIFFCRIVSEQRWTQPLASTVAKRPTNRLLGSRSTDIRRNDVEPSSWQQKPSHWLWQTIWLLRLSLLCQDFCLRPVAEI